MNDSREKRYATSEEELQSTHLPGLIVRMIDDVVRMADAETKLFEGNIELALVAALDRAVGRAIASVIYLAGGLCLLGAAIMLLRRWLPWWEALALAGVATILAGCLVQTVTGRLAARQSSRSRLE